MALNLFLILAVFTAALCKTSVADNTASAPTSVYKFPEVASLLSQSQFQLGPIPNVSRECWEDLNNVTKNLKEYVMYLDAFGKPGSGLFQGNRFMLGSYEECKLLPNSHVCTTTYDFLIQKGEKPLSQMISICTPQRCSQNDVQMALNHLLKAAAAYHIIAFPDPTFAATYGSPVICKPLEMKISAGAVVTIIICVIFLALALIGTIADVVKSAEFMRAKDQAKFQPVSVEHGITDQPLTTEDDSSVRSAPQNGSGPPISMLVGVTSSTSNWLLDFILCFSMLKNSKSIMKTSSPPGAIQSINGIRTLSMWWVILGHTYFFNLGFTDNALSMYGLVQRFSFLPIINGTFSVDSFFLLSGLLVSYLTLRRATTKDGFPWLQYYLHRFLRLTPAYMFVILFTVYVYPLMGEGPMWFQQGAVTEGCKKYWWTNLLYINNFYPDNFNTGCIGWSWYLANDMQFYVISPIVILAMVRFKWIGACLSNGFLLLASLVTTAIIADYYGVPSLGDTTVMGHIYVKPYCRFSPYLVGLFLGFVLFKKVNAPRTHRTMIAVGGWCLAIIVGMATVYGNWNSYKKGGSPMGLTAYVFYTTLTRFSWGCALAWVVYACHSGLGGLLNRFLSWSAFIPLSRLTYSAYLLHPLIMMLHNASRQVPWHHSDRNVVYEFASYLTLAYACAYVLALTVEYPLMNLEHLLLRRMYR